MLQIKDIILLHLELVLFVTSAPWILFILIVNLLEWIQIKRLNLTDQLIFGISIATLSSVIIHIMYNSATLVLDTNLSNGLKVISSVLYVASVSCTIWFYTWLSVHFCLKIVNINNYIYIYFQNNFCKIHRIIFFQTVLAALFISLPPAWEETETSLSNNTDFVSNDVPLETVNTFHKITNAYCTVAFLLFCSSASIIIASLFRHMKNIKGKDVGLRPNLGPHLRGAKFVTSLLVQNVIYFTATIMLSYGGKNVHLDHFGAITTSIFYISSSLTLIKGNNKLDKKMDDMLLLCRFTEPQINPTI
ncbi:taste receptor type 2 member 4-like [Pelobates fuscus]|uniref:taste receptor type 2 member 4-like n=1 Tax=Pelobates fuscus TaxID=191477 RepID=UPI002FE45DB7